MLPFVVQFCNRRLITSDIKFDLRKALKSALGGGLSGAAGTLLIDESGMTLILINVAMILQVLTLMVLFLGLPFLFLTQCCSRSQCARL